VQKWVEGRFGAGRIWPGDQADGDLGIVWPGDELAHQRIWVRRCRLEHGWHRQVADTRNALPIIVRDVGACQQTPRQCECFGLLSYPGCVHGLLKRSVSSVKVWVGHDHVVFG
jgi:hypothetical protein